MLKRNLYKIICIIAVICVTMTALCSCEKKNEVESGQGITFTDDLGREINLMGKPERVAALIGSFAGVWQLSGGEVCATVDDAQDFGVSLENTVILGGAHSPGAEALLSANPDFVIASASTSADIKLKDLLENAGITVAYFDVDNFYDYLHMLDICTDITGRKDLYEMYGLKIKDEVEKIKNEVKNASFSEKEKKILLLRASSGSVKAKGSKGTVLGEMLSDMGMINIADSDSTLLETLSAESIISMEPYRIFIVTMGEDTKKATENFKNMLSENGAWATLDAVKKDRIYVMDKKLFNNKPNEKWAVSYEKLKEILLSE